MQHNMQSSIQVKNDFEKNTPFIRIVRKNSTHIVDELLNEFVLRLNTGVSSNWLRVECNGEQGSPNNLFAVYDIYPISGEELPITADKIRDRVSGPAKKDDRTIFPSRFALQQDVAFATEKDVEKAFNKARTKAPLDASDEDVVHTPDYRWGKIVAVKFTESKVYYDCIDDVDNKVYKEIPSHYVKLFDEGVIGMVGHLQSSQVAQTKSAQKIKK